MEILYFIADGKEYMEIAKKLKVAISTIQTHIRKLYKKLNAHSKTQAILKARESGILN
jgi:DNA-binding NarL/FixJ family response regulator